MKEKIGGKNLFLKGNKKDYLGSFSSPPQKKKNLRAGGGGGGGGRCENWKWHHSWHATVRMRE